MQERFNKYFWDSAGGWNNEYIVRRILERASFADLIGFPYNEVKSQIDKIDINKLWTSETRKHFLIHLKPHIKSCNLWEEAIEKLVAQGLANISGTFEYADKSKGGN